MPLLKPGFSPVPEDKRIVTIQFIESCEKIPGFFDLLGSRVFSPVKNDVIGNVTKIKNRYLADPEKFATLDDIISAEREETDKTLKAKDGSGLATNALMWLKRGLRFILLFVEHLVNNDYDSNPENLKSCAKLAYKGSLEPFHGWIVGKVVTAATNACPYRSVFMKTLLQEEGLCTENEVVESATVFLVNFKATVDTVYELFEKTGAEKTQKV